MVNYQGTAAMQLDRRIECIKYVIFCLSIILWLLACSVFGLSVWLRAEEGFQEWVEYLEMQEYYIGLYILILISIIVMFVSLVGCGVALMNHIMGLYVSAGLQLFCYVTGLAGAGVLLDYSTLNSHIQPIIRRSMLKLISESNTERAAFILRVVQENVACCGADGPMDYLKLLKPLPTECRDTVTGNAFFHGCVDELSWFLESRSGWLAGVTLSLCMTHVVLAILSLILVEAIKKEEQSITYKR